MSKRGVVVGVLGAASLFVVGEAGASANVVWCYTDPPIQVTTPAGHNLTVNNTVYLPPGSGSIVQDIRESATAVPDGHGGTQIRITTYVPEAISRTTIVSTENRYQVSTSASAEGGEDITTDLDVPTS